MANSSADRPPVVHHVFFWLKDPSSPADMEQLLTGLKSLADIPGIRELYIGLPAPTGQRDVVDASWQVSELMFFDNLDAQAGYQQHPLHRTFVTNCSHLWEKVVVYDTSNIYHNIR
jgi:hypothetical protein